MLKLALSTHPINMHFSNYYCAPTSNPSFENPHFIRSGINWIFEGPKLNIPIFSGVDAEYSSWKDASLPLLNSYPDSLKTPALRSHLDPNSQELIAFISDSETNAFENIWWELDRYFNIISPQSYIFHDVLDLLKGPQAQNLVGLEKIYNKLNFNFTKLCRLGNKFQTYLDPILPGISNILYEKSQRNVDKLVSENRLNVPNVLDAIWKHMVAIKTRLQNSKLTKVFPQQSFDNSFSQTVELNSQIIHSCSCHADQHLSKDSVDCAVQTDINCTVIDGKLFPDLEHKVFDNPVHNIHHPQSDNSEQGESKDDTVVPIESHVFNPGVDFSSQFPTPLVIPTITIDDYSEPSIDHVIPIKCLLCNSDDHIGQNCQVFSNSKLQSIVRKRHLCFLCLNGRYDQTHDCTPFKLCLNTCCKIKPLHSAKICNFEGPDPSGCVMFSTNDENFYAVNRLQTLILWVFDPVTKKLEPIRCMTDTGASHSWISATKAKSLHLNVLEMQEMNVSSFGRRNSIQAGIVSTNVYGPNSSKIPPSKMTFLAADNIIPVENVSALSLEQSQMIKKLNIKLADSQANKNGQIAIDALIGQDYYYNIVSGNTVLLPGGLRLVSTVYDTHMLAGESVYRRPSISDKHLSLDSKFVSDPPQTSNFAAFDTLTSEEEMYNLDRFSSLDALGILPDEDIHPALTHFKETVKYKDNRFEVELPKNIPQLKKLLTNFPQAFRRTVGGLKKRFKNADKTEYTKYNELMAEYISKDILEEVACIGTVQEVNQQLSKNPQAFDRVAVDSEDTPVCYLPHFGVYKPSTKKLRIVYDAKSKPFKGSLSLNDCLEKGPNLMNSLVRILLCFRKGKFAAKADIEKAFLQVGISPKDRDLCRIVWIIDEKVYIYRFNRLCFGLSCSPFLLHAVMHHTLLDSEIDQETRDHIISSFYVDDSVYSDKTLKGLLSKRTTAIDSFHKAGMPLRDWNSNNPEAQAIFSSEESNKDMPAEETVLGLLWNLLSDTIGVNHKRVLELVGQLPATKRTLWSFVHSLYDPLGLIAPYTIQAKFLCNEISKVVKGWDDKIPVELAQKVTDWMEDYKNLEDFRVPRCNEVENPVWKKLVGFCDASGKGIATCVYLVSSDGKQTVSHFVKANTHIPKESLRGSIPRLELLGAVMLSRLMTEVRKAYPEISADNIYYFTDAADVLQWIRSGSIHPDIFIANRISVVRELTEVSMWEHVSSAENPADIPSRGMSLLKLKDMPIWRYGPDFIREDMIDHKSTVPRFDSVHTEEAPDDCLDEIKPAVNLVSSDCLSEVSPKINLTDMKPEVDAVSFNCLHDVSPRIHLVTSVFTGVSKLNPKVLISKVMNINNFNSYHKLILTTSVILEFINKLNARRMERLKKPSLLKVLYLDPSDSVKLRSESELLWIRATQLSHFPGIHLLINDPNARVAPSVKSVFFQHGIFLDPSNNVLCCSSRLQNSNLPLSTIYPMLLPSHSAFTHLYILHVHLKVGNQLVPETLTYIRKQFWILKGRQVVRAVLSHCNHCKNVDGKAFPLPPFPPLPDFRTQRSHAFSATGLDFTGPFQVRDMDGSIIKTYVLLLTCAVTRCVHLEVTRSLAVNDVILALERFYSFRGIPKHLESDNGSNFVRCNRELKFVLKSERAQKYFDQSKINWNFYTSNSPHMGGFIEKLNDIYKRVSRKTFGKNYMLNFEEFRTMIAYSMAVLNDRPLTYVYWGNSSEGLALTPNKLTIGHDVLEPPHIRFEAIKDDISKKLGDQFVELEKTKDDWWEKFSGEYLTGLFERDVRHNKTSNHLPTPKLGDVCLLKVKGVPRRQWKLCRVIGFKKPRRDHHIRQCKIKTLSKKGKPSILNRSPQFLIPMEIEPHVITDDPLAKMYISTCAENPIPEEPDKSKFQPLPPFWTQPTKLPKSVKKVTKPKKCKKPRTFRAKGKFPAPIHKKVKKLKTKLVKPPSNSLDLDQSVHDPVIPVGPELIQNDIAQPVIPLIPDVHIRNDGRPSRKRKLPAHLKDYILTDPNSDEV